MKPKVSRRSTSVLIAIFFIGIGYAGLHASTPDVLSFLFSIGSEGSANNQFIYPIGIAAGGPQNRIYVTDTESFDGRVANDRIQVFGSNGGFVYAFGGPGSGQGQFSFPYGVAVDGNGTILVADSGNNRLQLFDANFGFLREFGHRGNYDPFEPGNNDEFGNYVGPTPQMDGFYFPTRVALRPGTRLNDSTDTAGRVAVLDNGNHRVVVLDSTLQPIFTFGTFGIDGNGLGNFEYPFGVGMDATRIYVADPQNHRIQVFDQNGQGLFFFGSTGETNSPGDLQNPYDAQPDGQGHLLVTDTDNNRVLILAEDPNVDLTPRCSDVVSSRDAGRCAIVASNGTRFDARVVGTDGQGSGQFSFPQSVATDALGQVIVLDSDNHRFQVFQATRVRVLTAVAEPAGPVQAGQTVTLTTTVRNEGGAALTIAPTAVPSLTGQLSSPPAQSAAPGAILTFTSSFVTGDTGSLTFDVSATGTSATGATVGDGPLRSNAIAVGMAQGAQLLVTLHAGPAKTGPGGTVTATVTAKNTGNVPLTSVAPAITLFPAGILTASGTPQPPSVSLGTGQSHDFVYTYVASTTTFGTVTFAAGGSANYGSSGALSTTGPTQSVDIVSDAQPPSSTLTRQGTLGQGGWYTSNVQVAITATDNVGVAWICYRVDGLFPFTGRVAGNAATFTVTFQGGVDVTYWAVDTAGNAEPSHRVRFGIDSEPPAVSAGGVQPAPNAAGWINAYPLVAFLASDPGSGVASVTGQQTIRVDRAGIVVPGTATDAAGNSADARITVNIDTQKPAVVCEATSQPTGLNGWYTAASVTVKCRATDQAGLSGLAYVSALCEGGTTGVSTFTASGTPGVGAGYGAASCTISAEGQWDVRGESRDVAGNLTITPPIRIKIDRTPPTVVCGTASGGEIWPPNHKMVAWNTAVQVTDLVSGSAGFKLTGFSSSEAANAKGDGTTSVDMSGWTIGTPDTAGLVRAERSGLGTGRIYRTYYIGTDGAGNTKACMAVLIEVPHDQGNK